MPFSSLNVRCKFSDVNTFYILEGHTEIKPTKYVYSELHWFVSSAILCYAFVQSCIISWQARKTEVFSRGKHLFFILPAPRDDREWLTRRIAEGQQVSEFRDWRIHRMDGDDWRSCNQHKCTKLSIFQFEVNSAVGLSVPHCESFISPWNTTEPKTGLCQDCSIWWQIGLSDTLERLYLTRHQKHKNWQRLWRLLSDSQVMQHDFA